MQVDALEQKLRAGDVPSFLYTIPFYHNPTGAVLPADRCKRLIELARQFDFSIISDEPYNLLGFAGKNNRSLASYDSTGRVLSLGSFSKILAPGLRLGTDLSEHARQHEMTVADQRISFV
jgi:2-aminoadipate transaminase